MQNDFSKGPVWKNIISQALPLTVAQVVHLLYNVVDRIYIGHMGEEGSMALTGVGLTFPVLTLIMAFAALFGMGGVPLFAIERGAGDEGKAARILGNSFTLTLCAGLILTALGYIFMRPALFAIGASEESYRYASEYLKIYLAGTVFSVIATGLVGYVNAQGFPRTGMLSVVIGCAVNIALDPLFIFAFRMGIAGAALATVISQAVSAAWVLAFLFGKKAAIKLKLKNMKPDPGAAGGIVRLGTSNFIMQATNFAVQVTCNSTLHAYGGDLYVGVMTVTNSIREIFTLPINGIVNGAQPVISYNFGAGEYKRAREGINFNTLSGSAFTVLAWLLVFFCPSLWFGIFTDDPAMTEAGIDMLRIYFFGFAFMALQFSGQSAFQALGDARHAIFFSLLRKVVIVVTLTLLLPTMGFGVRGVFLAEPISNVVGGTVCYLTKRRTAYRRLA